MPPIPAYEEDKERMVDVATLIFKTGSKNVRQHLADLLQRTGPKVRRRLYVQLHPQPTPDHLLSILPLFYEEAAKNCARLDVRLLLGVDKPTVTTKIVDEDLRDTDLLSGPFDNDSFNNQKKYDYVVLGGTFDRFHYGHKYLLSSAILLARRYIVCGITDKEMIHKKTLWELIQPVEKRISDVHEFVNDVSSNVELRAEPIIDPYGPSIIDSQLQCIVVSKETIKGGNAVNKKRQERGLSTLDIYEIELLDGSDEVLNETKLSSSAARRALLGCHLQSSKVPNYPYAREKYVIGLTGGICSGKTHISKFLKDQGCSIINCDKMGHELMADSEELRLKLEQTFGNGVVKDGAVDRKCLGVLVFKNKDRLKQLTDIMWPLMAERLLEKISNADHQIVVVDAPALVEAGWDKYVHEVWTSMIPGDEAVKRTMERDNLTEELAKDRVNSQPSNSERIASSTVIFCSLWEYKETERQVRLALDAVCEKLKGK